MGHLCTRKSWFDKHWCTTFDHAFNVTIYMHIHPKKLYVYPNMTKFEKKNKIKNFCMNKKINTFIMQKWNELWIYFFHFYNDEFDPRLG